MGEELNPQEQIDYLFGVVAAHRTLSISYLGLLMATSGVTFQEVDRILLDFIEVVKDSPENPFFSVGERQELEKIRDALRRMSEIQGARGG